MSIVLGLAGGLGHDASACLIVNGRISALVEEERVSRIKRAPGRAPVQAVQACLAAAAVRPEQVDTICFAWNSALDPDHATMRSVERELLLASQLGAMRPKHIYRAKHHECHAQTALYFAGAPREAIVIVADGRGETSSTTIFKWDGNCLETIAESPIHASLGTFFGAATDFCGFSYGGQGRTMAAAAFGRADEHFPSFRVEDLTIVNSEANQTDSQKWPGSPTRAQWMSRFHRIFGEPRATSWPTNNNIDVEHPTLEQPHADAAAVAQSKLERLLIQLCSNTADRYPGWPILLTGGVALNCAANGSIRAALPSIDLRLNPSPADSGTSLGAALIGITLRDYNIEEQQPTAFLGLHWADAQIKSLLDATGIRYAHSSDPTDEVAKALLDGLTVGRFADRAEIGPRALGNRSILASSSYPGISDRLNKMKSREQWRPFGPSILREDMSSAFADRTMRYMIEAIETPNGTRDRFPNITHIDGTSRPQTVHSSVQPNYARLLRSIGTSEGICMALNTSFNQGSEPIVSTPIDAIRTFFGMPIDLLQLGSYLIRKNAK